MSDDFQERVTSANRARRCARLVSVSSAAGEQTGASASAGAPVEFSSEGAPPGFWRCRRLAPLGASHCSKHSEVVPEPSIVSVTPQTLLVVREEIFEKIGGVFANKIGEVFYDARARRGRSRKGILDEDVLMDAINSGLTANPEIRARITELVRDSRDVLTRSQLRALRGLLVSAVFPGRTLNTEVVAAHYGISPRAARNLVRSANSTLSREADSMPLTKADMNELREELEERYEALHADVRATLAVVLERFPDSNTVAAAVDEFLDGTLRD